MRKKKASIRRRDAGGGGKHADRWQTSTSRVELYVNGRVEGNLVGEEDNAIRHHQRRGFRERRDPGAQRHVINGRIDGDIFAPRRKPSWPKRRRSMATSIYND